MQDVRQRCGRLIRFAHQQQRVRQVRFVDLRTLDLFAFIRTDEPASGAVPLTEVPRLLAKQAADVPADANTLFSWHSQGLVRGEATAGQLPCQRLPVDLEVEGAVWLQCQQCLKVYERPLPVRTCLEVMCSEAEVDAAPLDDDETDMIVGSRHFDLIAQIEDELLLALPVSPRRAVCPDKVLPEEAGAEKRPSPFAVLADLKTKH